MLNRRGSEGVSFSPLFEQEKADIFYIKSKNNYEILEKITIYLSKKNIINNYTSDQLNKILNFLEIFIIETQNYIDVYKSILPSCIDDNDYCKNTLLESISYETKSKELILKLINIFNTLHDIECMLNQSRLDCNLEFKEEITSTSYEDNFLSISNILFYDGDEKLSAQFDEELIEIKNKKKTIIMDDLFIKFIDINNKLFSN